MKNHTAKNIKEAPPSCPVQIGGLVEQPILGDVLQAVESEQEARKKAISILNIRKQQSFGSSIHQILAQIHAGKLKMLKIVVKADTNGSLEAIKQAFSKLKNEEVSVQIIHSGVGMITDTDVNMAMSSEGLVIGFNVLANRQVKKHAEIAGVEILVYQIIYKLIEDITNLLSGMLDPEKLIENLGTAEVKKIFFTGRKEMTVGCRVMTGSVASKAMVKVMRGGENVGDGIIQSLRKGDETIESINEGNECGIKFVGTLEILEGDVFDVYKESFKKKTFAPKVAA